MVWFDESGRMALCEPGMDGFLPKPTKPNNDGIDSFQAAPLSPCISGFDGFVIGDKK